MKKVEDEEVAKKACGHEWVTPSMNERNKIRRKGNNQVRFSFL